MDRLSMYFYRCLGFMLITIIGDVHLLTGQGNCLLYPADSGERIACELSYRAIEYRQGSKESQLLFDQAIQVGPKYAWAYYQKSTPFFKRGLFADGVSLINKAIELEPQNYLHYRAYWYFYNRSYEMCIRDLEELYAIHKISYISTPGGELEMRILLALSHAQTGNVPRGVYWMLDLMKRYKDQPALKGTYDHFCLGMLYYKNDQYDLAEAELEKQLAVDSNFADTYYYLGLIKEGQAQHKLAEEYFKKALARMNRENGGYSANLFTEYNTHKEDIEKVL